MYFMPGSVHYVKMYMVIRGPSMQCIGALWIKGDFAAKSRRNEPCKSASSASSFPALAPRPDELTQWTLS